MFEIERYTVKGHAATVAQTMVEAQGNYHNIGSGCFGTVYGDKNSKVVYKIGNANDNRGYLAYVDALSKLEKHNPFHPRIFGVRFIKGKLKSHMFVVAMERLRPVKYGDRQLIKFASDLIRGNGVDKGPHTLIGVELKIPEALQEAIDLLRRAKETSRTGWDLHDGNFMMRGNQLVVTDPLA